jgi:putative flippase GtrA
MAAGLGRDLRRYTVFLGGSALGAVADYAVTLTGVRLLGLSPEAALALAMIFSSMAVFLWHEHVTFTTAGAPGKPRRFVVFMGWSAVILALRAALLFVMRKAGVPVWLALALAIGIASVINYIISSRRIFRT